VGWKSIKRQIQPWMVPCGVLLALFLLIMMPGAWYSNEEDYLGRAWRRFSPPDVAAVSAMTDPVNYRWLFDSTTGLLIHALGFDWTHALGRSLVSALYAVSLAMFFRTIGLSLAAGCLVIMSFLWCGEDILGGEWLFRGFEPKTLAYPLVFFSLVGVLRQRYRWAAVLMAIATYFHFLVGGFWFFVIALCQWVWLRRFKPVVKTSLWYLGLCIPVLALIAQQQLALRTVASAVQQTTVDWVWVYTAFRNSHHVTPFSSPQSFANWYNNGIVLLVGCTIAAWWLWRISQTRAERACNGLIWGLHLYLWVALGVAWFDKTGTLSKFYWFRPSSLILFLLLASFVRFLVKHVDAHAEKFTLALLALVSSAMLPWLAGQIFFYQKVEAAIVQKAPINPVTWLREYWLGVPVKDPPELRSRIEASKPTEITLIDPQFDSDYLNFERRYDRPILLTFKSIPNLPDRILLWYDLLQQRQELFSKGCSPQPATQAQTQHPILTRYDVRYLLAPETNGAIASCGKSVFRGDGVQLIDLKVAKSP
jgi:hypothetical protein